MSPLLAEVLPGATRFSSLFVFPIEMCVWGGGALLIRDAVRRWRLAWLNMLLLATALAIAEECLIQQTSLAPMVLQLKGQPYARACGVNYVYFLWALVYEVAFVVFLPVYLVELIFPSRREEAWVNKAGLIATIFCFLIGTLLAWYSWTHIARPKVFHAPIYNPPPTAFLISGAAIIVLVFAALGPFRGILTRRIHSWKPPQPWLLGTAGAAWAVFWYGLVLLAFGIAPAFPPWLALGAGLLVAVAILFFLPRWAADPRFQKQHQFAIIFGTMLGSMAVSFIGFIGALPLDLYFKVVVDLLAVAFMVALGLRIGRAPQIGT
jgi:hypothetical protein